jgi:uncharacterized membrane protein YkvA (DUF1232 family)
MEGDNMLPEWALVKARSVSTDDLLDLVRKCPAPARILSPVNKIVLRLSAGSLSGKQKIAAIAALVYLVTFWDVIPDIPIIGFVDDLAVIMSVLSKIES